MRNFTSMAVVMETGITKLLNRKAYRRWVLAAWLLLLCGMAESQTATPVAVTGYTDDVIANGTTFATSVTADVDGGGYYFLNQSFTALGTPTYYLPISGTFVSAASSSVIFQVPDATTSNSLRLVAANATGTLTFTSPQSASTIYLLAASGGGSASVTYTVNFTDGGWQTFSSQTIPDWYNNTGYAIQGIGRTTSTGLDAGGGTTNPRLYQIALTISSANYTKQVASITVNKLTATGVAHVMGVSAIAPCVAPSAQPTALTLTATTSTISGAFTAASPAPNSYLIVSYPTGATPVAPVNGTTYTAGSTLGTGTVVQVSPATSFALSGIAPSTTLDFYIYAVNNNCTGGPIYNTVSPLTGTKATTGCAAFSGTFTVGPTGNYPNLTAATQALAGGVNGPVVFELQSNYTSTTETFPIIFNYSGCFSSTNTLTVRPAAGANNLQIVNPLGVPTFDFRGANYVTIDGRPGGAGSSIAVTAAGSTNAVNLNIISTNAAGMAIRLDSGASNNTIKYCDLQGQNTAAGDKPTTTAGVIYFGNNGANGNDNNTIDHCNIHSTGTGASKPSIAVYSLGYDNQSTTQTFVARFNDNNSITNCNIYDYYAAASSAGVELNLGNSGWTINGNSFFETEPIVISSFNRPLYIVPYRSTYAGEAGNGFVVTNNFIGGTAPAGGGTNPYTIASGSTGYFDGMELELKDNSPAMSPTFIQANTITNISVTTSGSSEAFHGMLITNGSGNVNVGAILGNTISGITITATNAVASYGLSLGGTYTITANNNTIGNILLTAPGNTFGGIYGTTSITGVFNNNLITNIADTSSGTTTGRYLAGIYFTGSPTLTITNNTIQNLKLNYNTTGASTSQVAGININTTTAVMSGGITGNIIRNLSNATQSTATGTSSALVGICMNSTNSVGCTISKNIIDSLVDYGAATSAAVNVLGMYINAGTSVSSLVTKNFIHTLDVNAVNPSAVITGIQYNAGTATFANNMIRLGIKPDGTANTTALNISGILSGSASANNFYHNSIYIGGSGVGTNANNTYAFRRSATSGTYDVRDNIFVNNRSNATTGGKHYVVNLATASTGFGSNYNIYQYNGTGGVFAFNGAADIGVYNNSGAATPGWIATDINSITGDPNFINPTGSVSAVNLHINTTGVSAAEGRGIAIAAVTDDIDGDNRSSLTPTDIGADAGNFTATASCATPNAPTGLVLTVVSNTKISGSFTAPTSGASGYIVVRYLSGSTPTTPVNGVLYTAGSALGTGNIVMVGTATSFIDSGLVANSKYDYYVYSYNAGCLGEPVYSTSLTGSQTTGNCSGPSGLITVGPTGTFPTLTQALTSLNGTGISGPVVVELQSDYGSAYVTANETFPIVINSNSCFSTTNTVTIRPAANASALVIRSSNAGPTIAFTGGNYVTIDGRPGGVGSAMTVTAAGDTNKVNLNIINTNTTAGAAISIDSNASHNTVKYCDLQGQNNTVDGNIPTTMAGVVYFGSKGANGSDNNTIDHCNIHSAGTGTNLPTIGVYALGATNTGLNTNFDDADTISNCNIYDFFHASKNTMGIELTQGVANWVITGNSLFQTASRATTSTTVYNKGIWAFTNRTGGTSAGNGFIITNNYIGGSAPQAGGTPYTFTIYNNTFGGIRLEVADNGITPNPSIVQGNTITNILINGTGTGSNPLEAIVVTNTPGNVNVLNNTIGAATGNDAIKITMGAGTSVQSIGLLISPSATSSVVNVKNNTVGSITTTGNANSITGLYGNASGNIVIDGNLFGSLTTANSLNATSTGTSLQFVRGISIGTSATGTYSITNNTVANLTNNTTSSSTGSQTAGILLGVVSTYSVPVISKNTIRNLYCSAAYTSGSTNSVLLGIGMGATSTTSPVIVTGNTVHSLTSGAATAGVFMEGIFFSGSSSVTNNTISKNFVHSFDVNNTTNTSLSMRGIELNGGGGNIINNMVRLGIRPDGTSMTSPIKIDAFLISGTASVNANVYNNSAYVGGTGVGSNTNITSAFHKEVTNATDSMRNNIFVNNRSNATAPGLTLHYAVNLNGTSNLTFNNNIYGYGGTGGGFVTTTNNSTTPTAAAYAATWLASDSNSQAADPKFVDPVGPATSVDLHITTSAFSPANGAAVPLAAVTDDIDGDPRDATNPDVGADEFTQSNGIDMQAVSLVAPTSAKGCYSKENVVIRVRNNSSASINFALHPVTITVNVSGATTATISTVLNTDTLAAGATKDVTLAGTANQVNMTAPGTYIFDAKTSVVNDIKLSNDAMQTDTRTKVSLVSGNISVSTNTYCLNGMPVLTNTNATGYDTLHWQRSATPGVNYGNITNAYGTSYKDTIAQTAYYRLMATCATDTAYTAEVEVIVHTPKILGTTPATRCDAGKVTLNAIGSAGTTLTWYTDSTGSNAITTGSSLVTSTLSVTDTFYVSATESGCESKRTAVIATINNSVKIITQPVGQIVCPGSTVTFTVAATGTSNTYQWRKNGVNIGGATDTFYTITGTTPANAGSYEVVITNTCGIVTSTTAALTVASTNTWVGNVSSDWNTAANWCGGVPGTSTDVTINAGTPYSPVVTGTSNVHTLTISRGATVTVASNGTLNIYGNYINNGALSAATGTVAFRGAASQSVDAITAANVIMNGTGGVVLNGHMTISSTLTLTTGNITLGTYDLYLINGTTGSIGSHIITNGPGSVVIGGVTAAVSVPVGFSAGTLNPVTISNGQGLVYTVRVAQGLIASVLDNNKAINRTWTVTTTTVPASPVNITVQYADAEANPGCNPAGIMDAGAFNGITYALVSPQAGITPAGTAPARLATVSTTQLGSFVLVNQGALKVIVTDFKVQLLPTVINNGSATLKISTPRTMRLEWTINDVAGQLVKKFTTQATPGVNTIPLSLPGLANGIYYLHAVSDDGKIPVIRFMIQH